MTGTINLETGSTLSIIARNITIGSETDGSANLIAPDGTINIAGVAGNGETLLDPAAGIVKGQSHTGNISILPGPNINMPGIGTLIDPFSISVGSGAIFIRGGQIVIDNSALSASNSGTNQSGMIHVTGKSLTLKNGAALTTSNVGSESSGDIVIKATQGVELSGSATETILGLQETFTSMISSSTAGNSGDTGDISINTPRLVITDGGLIQSTSSAIKGRVGDIHLNANQILITNGAQGDNSSNGEERTGNIQISANQIHIDTQGSVSSSTTVTGNAGNINVTGTNITMNNGGRIEAVTRGSGHGGNIKISSSTLELSGGSAIAANSFSANPKARSGNITISAVELLQLRENSSISVETETADAGSIDIQVRDVLHLIDSDITTCNCSDPLLIF